MNRLRKQFFTLFIVNSLGWKSRTQKATGNQKNSCLHKHPLPKELSQPSHSHEEFQWATWLLVSPALLPSQGPGKEPGLISKLWLGEHFKWTSAPYYNQRQRETAGMRYWRERSSWSKRNWTAFPWTISKKKITTETKFKFSLSDFLAGWMTPSNWTL